MKQLSVILLLATLFLTALGYSGGDGTSGAPYQIATTTDLIYLSKTSGDWSAHFIQTADIAFNSDEQTVDWDGDGSASWDTEDQAGFSPIGNNLVVSHFKGSYDGNGHTISNLYIDRAASDHIGLFGYLSGSQIKNLGLIDINITGKWYVGGLTGWNTDGATVSNCYCTGVVSGGEDGSIGGFVGTNVATISNCYSRCDVVLKTGESAAIGGFCGINTSGSIEYCYSIGKVYESPGTIWDSDDGDASSGRDQGFIGSGVGSCSYNFFDTEASEQTSGVGATAKTTAEMKTLSTFTSANWDFESETTNGTDDYWDMSGSINDGYPYLSWQDGGDVSLPVELTSFSAVSQSGGVVLSWRTESEAENLGFIIQRQTVGSSRSIGTPADWSQIASYTTVNSLAGHGSTSEAHEYAYTDAAVVPGAIYLYRLADVDYSGVVTWHGEVEVKVKVKDGQVPLVFGLQPAYPNPFNPSVTIPYGLTEDGQMSLKVYNLRGELVQVLINTYALKGTYSINWQPVNLSTGMYLVRLESGNKTNMQKVVIVK